MYCYKRKRIRRQQQYNNRLTLFCYFSLRYRSAGQKMKPKNLRLKLPLWWANVGIYRFFANTVGIYTFSHHQMSSLWKHPVLCKQQQQYHHQSTVVTHPRHKTSPLLPIVTIDSLCRVHKRKLKFHFSIEFLSFLLNCFPYSAHGCVPIAVGYALENTKRRLIFSFKLTRYIQYNEHELYT